MVVIEMRDAAYDTAFELLDEAKHSAKKTKLTLCELEDAMYDCYEASKENENELDDDYSDMEYRNRYSTRNYRHDEYDPEEYEDDTRRHTFMRRMPRRSSMRMRRNRMGRFV